MVNDPRQPQRIMRKDFDRNAPTGEGDLWQTEDGRWWHQRDSSQPVATGESVGKRVGDYAMFTDL